MKQTDGEQLSFCEEFSSYIEKLSCASEVILLAGDFNVDWLDGNGLERRQLYNIFETFGFTQNINVATSKHHHLLTIFLLVNTVSTYRILHFLILSVTIEPYMRRCAVYALIRYVSVSG